MDESSLVKKLQIRPADRLLLLNAPPGYRERLGELAERVVDEAGTEMEPFEVVHLFVRDSGELQRLAPAALAAAGTTGALWVSYPKRSSGVETDLTRDEGWEVIHAAGFQGVRQVSIDETWSAVRFKIAPTGEALIEQQYEGAKAHLRPIYERLVDVATALGPDVSLNPRQTYVALNRSRQFALIQASTRQRVDLGLKLPEREPGGRLQAAGSFGSGSITHKVALHSVEEVDEEVAGWLRAAYEQVGP